MPIATRMPLNSLLATNQIVRWTSMPLKPWSNGNCQCNNTFSYALHTLYLSSPALPLS